MNLQQKRSSIVTTDSTFDYDENRMRIEDTVSLGRDSLKMLGGSREEILKTQQMASRIELARDSLEIIRQATSKLSFNERRASIVTDDVDIRSPTKESGKY